jgi:hypothetical protein
MLWRRIKMRSAASGMTADDYRPSRSMLTDIGAVGRLAGAGTGTRLGLQVAATLAAKFRGFETRQDSHTMQRRADGASRLPRMMDPYRSQVRSSWPPRTESP